MAVVGTYDSDQQMIFFTKPLDITGDVNLSGNLTVGGSSPGGDIVVAAGSEYFQAVLTSDQEGITTTYNDGGTDAFEVVDFQAHGTQTGNTSNWDSTNNAYQLGSTGLYQLFFSAYNDGRYTNTTGVINVIGGKWLNLYVEASTDNFSTSTVLFGGRTQHSGSEGTNNNHNGMVSAQFLYSPTSTNTKVRLMINAYARNPGATGILTHKLEEASATIPVSFFNVVRLH
jgi:hypothetical protein